MKHLFTTILIFIFTITLTNMYVGAVDVDSISGIADVFTNIISSARYIAGGVLVVMVAYGVWKSSMALGDPRGLEGAKQTWTYAIYGFFIIMGVYIILSIAASIFGVSFNPLGGLGGALQELIGLPASSQTSGGGSMDIYNRPAGH